jgi:processive 1,2-diacylglycerol beta-glucosyltransferase
MIAIRRGRSRRTGRRGIAIHSPPCHRFVDNAAVETTAQAEGRGCRLLILSASAGTGHLRAAEALAMAAESDPRVANVDNVDCLSYTNKLFRRFYSNLYLQLIKTAPTFLGWFYQNTDEPWKTDRMRIMLSRLNLRPLVRMIRKLAPDIVICTHFLPAEIMSVLIQKKLVDAKLSIVVTDFDVHAMWLSRAFHHYFVAIDQAKVHLALLGLPENRVTVSGIPIDPAFGAKKDVKALKEKHGITPDRPVVLVSAGALGVGSAEHVVRILGYMKSPAHIVVVCGSNPALREEVLEKVQTLDAKHLVFHVLGYTNEMHEWMGIADLFIGKPGGLTTSEALASNLPMMIFQPIPGQEWRNSDHLLEQGVAIKCNQITVMAYKVDELLADPARMRRMSAAARKLAKPDAARTVIETLLGQADYAPVRVYRKKQKKMKEFARMS